MSEMISCTIPSNRTALGLLGTNRANDGDDFREDGWVYNEEVQMRKWFGNVDDSKHRRIWLPKLLDLVTLEATRWRVYERSKRIIDRSWPLMFRMMTDVGKAVCRWKDGWGVVESYPGEGISWLFQKEEASELHPGIAREYIQAEQHMLDHCRRCSLFNLAFVDAVQKRYGKDGALVHPGIRSFHLTINGRHYWFSVFQRSGYYVEIKKLSFPEDTVEVASDDI